MHFEVDGIPAYASTGGRKHDPDKPWIVFLHGAGSSHLSWVLQTRALSYDGWNVLAPDMPGHNLTGVPLRATSHP
ncbi:MAG: alpha/beta fold hydrolase [Nitratireductor sp.]